MRRTRSYLTLLLTLTSACLCQTASAEDKTALETGKSCFVAWTYWKNGEMWFAAQNDCDVAATLGWYDRDNHYRWGFFGVPAIGKPDYQTAKARGNQAAIYKFCSQDPACTDDVNKWYYEDEVFETD